MLPTCFGKLISGARCVFKKISFPLVFLMIIIPITISYGLDSASLRVINSTDYFLHVIIDGNPYLYISPQGSVSYNAEGKTSFHVQAYYSPGQEISGTADSTLDITINPPKTGCRDTSDSRGGGCECTTTPGSISDAEWDITDQDLQ